METYEHFVSGDSYVKEGDWTFYDEVTFKYVNGKFVISKYSEYVPYLNGNYKFVELANISNFYILNIINRPNGPFISIGKCHTAAHAHHKKEHGTYQVFYHSPHDSMLSRYAPV